MLWTVGSNVATRRGFRYSAAMLACGACFIGAPTARAQPATPALRDLGVLPSGNYAAALSCSVGGVIVVGEAATPRGDRGFRWTFAGGMSDLGTLPDGTYSGAMCVSGDGSTIVGYGDTPAGTRACVWRAGAGIGELGVLSGARYSIATGSSGDGSVVVGYCGGDVGYEAFFWTSGTGLAALAPPAGAAECYATAVSGDGRVVVGAAATPRTVGACRWTIGAGAQGLGVLPGGVGAEALAVSGDGAAITGYSDTPAGERAFIWTEAGGMQAIATLSGARASFGMSISADGSLITGYCRMPDGNHAFVWSEPLGMLDLNSYLPTLGVDLTGWVLQQACAISPDGAAITGYGRYQGEFRAWVVTGLAPCGGFVVTGHPADVYGCRGGTVVFSVGTATAPGQVLSYQWRHDGVPMSPSANPSSETAVLSIAGVGQADAGSYDCIVGNACGQTTTSAAVLSYCAADFNCNGTVSVQDLFDFLAAYFAGDPSGDFNESGLISVQDVFDFLAAYFAGCP